MNERSVAPTKNSIPAFLAVGVGVVVLCVAAFLFRGDTTTNNAARQRQPSSEANDPAPLDSTARDVNSSVARLPLLQPAKLVIVDAESNVPIPGVKIIDAAKMAGLRAVPDEIAADALTDSLGTCDLPSTERSKYVAVHERYIATSLASDSNTTTVRMERGRVARIRCTTTTGRPVADCLLALSRELYWSPRVSMLCFGSPVNDHPVWTMITGPDGMASREDLPAGSYRIIAVHREMYDVQANDRDRWVVPGQCGTVMMEDLWGTVFAIPGNPPVAREQWTFDEKKLSLLPTARAAAVLARRRLLERFNGAGAVTGLPAEPSSATAVEVQVLTEDGRLWQGAGILRPIREIASAVNMTCVQSSKPGQLLVMLVAGGSIVDGVQLSLGCRESPALRRDIRSGEVSNLPPGKYVITGKRGYLARVIGETQEAVVREGSLTTAHVRVPVAVKPVKVELRMPDGFNDLPCTVSIRNSQGSSTWPGWRREPGRSELELWCIAGPVSIEVLPEGYKGIEKSVQFDEIAMGQPIVVEVKLEKDAR